MQERQPRRMNDLDKATRLAGHEQDSQSRVPHASTVERRGFGRRPVERADDDRGGSAAPRLSESAFSHRHGPARISRAGLFSCAASSKDRRSNHCRGRRCQRRLGCWQHPSRWDSYCCASPKPLVCLLMLLKSGQAKGSPPFFNRLLRRLGGVAVPTKPGVRHHITSA